MDRKEKQKLLNELKEEMEKDSNLPLVKKPEDVVPGYGNPESKVVLIGEAAGYHESIQRKPFVGAAGQFLTQLLKLVGIDREDIYITNMVKTRPPNNRDPLPEELKAYEKYLDRELEIIQPKIIMTLGRFSMTKFLPGVTISRVHGKVHKVNWRGRQITVVPMYHPAAGLRNLDVKRQMVEDFRMLPKILEGMDEAEIEQSRLL